MAEIKEDLLTNSAYGYPNRGNLRRVAPIALICVHLTSNSDNLDEDAAQNERNFANRSGSNGPSAHIYLNRDGSGIKAINYEQYAAWSNGVLNSPNTNIAGVRAVVDFKAAGYNPNEAFWLEIENVGYSSTYPITVAQMDQMAQLIAERSYTTGIPINRNTVLTHADLDSINRASCAFQPAVREQRMADLIARAQEALEDLISSETIKSLKAQIAQLTEQNILLAEENSTLKDEIADLNTELFGLEAELNETVRENEALLATNHILQDNLNELISIHEEVKGAWQTLDSRLGVSDA